MGTNEWLHTCATPSTRSRLCSVLPGPQLQTSSRQEWHSTNPPLDTHPHPTHPMSFLGLACPIHDVNGSSQQQPLAQQGQQRRPRPCPTGTQITAQKAQLPSKAPAGLSAQSLLSDVTLGQLLNLSIHFLS